MKHCCLKTTMEDADRYSSPVPLIGLYTAVATIVCSTLIICDMWAGFRRKKLWLPCRFFSLNSVTLTLISISSKLPVDLTSPMPSTQDQLSKLTGTIFICLSMAFIMPSTGIIEEFQCYSNMVALSMFVTTVIVNICIQMATGVIFSFFVEHIIILFCMLLLNALLWFSSFGVNDHNEISIDKAKGILKNSNKENLLQCLKVCYIHGYHSSLQFYLCRVALSGTLSLICIVCLAVLAKVLLGSLASTNSREGVSAYGWSMWIVVVTQIVSIVVLGFAIGCRLVTSANHINSFRTGKNFPDQPYLRAAYSFYMPRWLDYKWLDFLRCMYNCFIIPFGTASCKFCQFFLAKIWRLRKNTRFTSEQDYKFMEYFRNIVQTHNLNVEELILTNAVEDMERLIKLNSQKGPHHLINLLSASTPSGEQLGEGRELSCLSILMLVEMAKVLLPNSLTVSSMEEIIAEVFLIMYFIDRKINVGSLNHKVKSMTAKVLLAGKTRTRVVQTPPGVVESQSKLARALGIISEFHNSFEDVALHDEACAIVDYFEHHPYASVSELYDYISLLFVDMLHALLSQLPKAIFNHLIESPPQEYEDRVRTSLKFVCQLQLLEPYVRWSFPPGCNITSLLPSQVPVESSPTSDVIQRCN